MTAWHGLTDPAFGVDVPSEEFFVKGGCHQLALALVSSIEGSSFVALYDRVSRDGLDLDEPWLVHAGALIGDDVIDVEGVHDREAWSEAWADQTRDPFLVEWNPDELPFVFSSPAHERFSFAVAAAIVAHVATRSGDQRPSIGPSPKPI